MYILLFHSGLNTTRNFILIVSTTTSYTYLIHLDPVYRVKQFMQWISSQRDPTYNTDTGLELQEMSV